MNTAPSGNGDYLVRYDITSTHARRVRIVVGVGSVVIMLVSIGWAVFFLLQGKYLIFALDIAMLLGSAYTAWLAYHGRVRQASLILAYLTYAILWILCGLFDVPNLAAPRSNHTYFLLLAVGSYLLFRDDRPLVRHGITVACFVAFVFFGSYQGALVDGYALSDPVRIGGTWVNNACAFAIMYVIVHTFIGDVTKMESYLHEANNRFVDLVRGMFPHTIAERLLTSGRCFAERHQNCSVLFADIVSFTRLAESMPPNDLVEMLSQIFSRFDALVEDRGLTKIKTIGDAYMVASGVPDPRADHAHALIALGEAMLAVASDFPGVSLRIGVASGELVAGVIGNSHHVYDVWGDAVNMASRMESQGLQDRIQVSESTYHLAANRFAFQARPHVAIKGRSGFHNVYVVAPVGT